MNASVVHQYIQPAEALQRGGHHSIGGVGVRNVRHVRQNMLGAHFFHDLSQVRLVAVDRDHLRSFRREATGGRRPDAGRRARDDDDLPSNFAIRTSSFR